jgi:phosphoribosylformylglycinamidine synthase
MATGSNPTPAPARTWPRCKRILQAGDGVADTEPGSVSRFVVPRLGTLSPWASKATELLRGAGLPVKRVERGMRIDVSGWPDDPARRPRWPSCCTTR